MIKKSSAKKVSTKATLIHKVSRPQTSKPTSSIQNSKSQVTYQALAKKPTSTTNQQDNIRRKPSQSTIQLQEKQKQSADYSNLQSALSEIQKSKNLRKNNWYLETAMQQKSSINFYQAQQPPPPKRTSTKMGTSQTKPRVSSSSNPQNY